MDKLQAKHQDCTITYSFEKDAIIVDHPLKDTMKHEMGHYTKIQHWHYE